MEFKDIVKGMTKEEIEEMVRHLNKKETLNEVENIKERK